MKFRPVDEVTKRRFRKMAMAGKIQMAPTEKLTGLGEFAIRTFIRKVLRMKPEYTLITDWTCLSDFSSSRKARENAAARVKLLYGVDCKPNDAIADILIRIASPRRSP